MLIVGRNNVKEILKKFDKNIVIKKAICQDNFNELDIINLIKSRNIPINYQNKSYLDRLAKMNHQGVILELGDFVYTNLNSIIDNKDKCFLVMLDHLEDPHNLGAIIRTCEASGVDGIILPINRSVAVNETVAKTSVGTLYNVPICQVTNLANTIKSLKKQNFWIIGSSMDGENFNTIKYPNKCVLIIGNEGDGMTRLVRSQCDYIATIPMYGKVNSLNASVAAGILIYKIVDR